MATITTANGSLTNPNIILFISDETRHPQHWPEGWVAQHLPVWQRLMDHGLTFTHCFTAASECCPARASFLTSTYPEENGVEVTISSLSPSFKNLATVLASSKDPHYPMLWKGKWHLSTSVNGGYDWGENDIAGLATNYGMQQWNPPDAGIFLGPGTTLGGGTPNNDGRFVNGVTAPGQTQGFGESVVDFIRNYDPSSGPFCLAVSLVNPHDVFLVPGDPTTSGYPADATADIGIRLPHNHHDDLSKKPSVQASFKQAFDTSYPLQSHDEQLQYVNFYAYLTTLTDQLFGDVMCALDGAGLTNDTIIIRMADHGEMGLSHGLREKMYNAYEETIRMPFVVSNPTLWPGAETTDAMASTLDLVPTLAAMTGSTDTSGLRGRSLLPVIEGMETSVQDSVVYTFDDQFDLDETVSGHIRCLRTHRWKYAVYFTESTSAGNFEYEMYDLEADPGEQTNLLHGTPAPAALAKWKELHPELTQKLEHLAAKPKGVDWPKEPWSGATATAS